MSRLVKILFCKQHHSSHYHRSVVGEPSILLPVASTSGAIECNLYFRKRFRQGEDSTLDFTSRHISQSLRFLGLVLLKVTQQQKKKPILFNMRFGASCVYVYLIFRGISMLTTRNKRKNMFLHNFSTFFPSSLPRVVVFRLR